MEGNPFEMILALIRLPALLLYAGPDQLLPLASILGTIIGILLIGWQRLVGLMRSVFGAVMRKVRSR